MILDKDHTKEYKRCRNELKKRSSDTLRLQKKAKKGTSDNLQSLVDSSMQTVNQQKAELDDVERKSLRTAMIEDRTRYCQFVNMLQPVVKQEYEMMYELGHLQVRTKSQTFPLIEKFLCDFLSPTQMHFWLDSVFVLHASETFNRINQAEMFNAWNISKFPTEF